MRLIKPSALAALLLGGVAPVALDAPAYAADASSSGDEVVVTTRRREEQLKDVPIAVTNFSSQRLEQVGAQDITALQQSTPNLTLQVARGSNSTLIAFIRGVGQQDPLWGFEPGVGLYVDDIYIARPQGAVLDIFDIDRIEVLRGPQGTLYGRNTIGGAVKYVTRKLSSQVHFEGRGQFGSYAQHDFIVSASAPLSDTLRIGGAIAAYNHGGYGKNLTTGAAQYNQAMIAFRASIEWSPTPDLFFRLSGDRTEDNSNARHGHREAVQGAFTVLPKVYDTQAGVGDANSVMTEGASLLAHWSATPELTLKSITAYRDGHTDTLIDFDNTPIPYLDIPAFYDDRQFTQEVQATYSGQRIQGIAGVYYLNANASGEFDTVVGNPALAAFGFPQTTATQGSVATRSISVFADVSVDLTDRLHASVGGRWTHDEKTGQVYRAAYSGLRSPFQGGKGALLLVRTNYTNKRTFSQFTPRVSATFEVTPDANVYASWSKGFKSGGFDMRGDAILTPSTVNGYDPEKVDTVEGGLKGSFIDRRLNLNAAVFYSWYKGQQITVQQLVGTTVASQVQNAGKSHIFGVELEGLARFTPDLVGTFAVGYIDAKFDQYLALDPATGKIVDVAATRVFQNTPKWTASGAVTWSHDAPGGRIALTGAVSYRDDMSMFEAPSVLDQPAYTLWNADLVWTSMDGHLSLGLHGKNLSDVRYRVGGYNFPGATLGNSIDAFYGPPRTFTFTAGVKF